MGKTFWLERLVVEEGVEEVMVGALVEVAKNVRSLENPVQLEVVALETETMVR